MKLYRAEVEMPERAPVFQHHDVYLASEVDATLQEREYSWKRLTARMILLTIILVLLATGWALAAAENPFDQFGNCQFAIDGTSYPCVGSHEPYTHTRPMTLEGPSLLGPGAFGNCWYWRNGHIVPCEGLNVPNDDHDGITLRPFPDPCLATLQAAMQSMDEFIDTQRALHESYDGCNTCTFADNNLDSICTTMACSGPREVSKLEWELKQAKIRAETAQRKTKAITQWVEAKKACWGK